MTWIVSGCASTMPASPNWHALVIEHDANGQAVETSPGQTSIVAIEVATWAVVLAIRPAPTLPGLPHGAASASPAPTQQQTALIPLDGAGERLDLRKGYLGLSPPNESSDEAFARLAPKASAHVAPVGAP